jgi:hypothetical protein
MNEWKPKVDWSHTEKHELLMHLHIRARDEIDFLRKRQDKIFQWSSSVLLLVIGALLVVDSTDLIIWVNLGTIGKMIASAAILILVVFAVWWQQRNREWQEESIEVMEKIERLFYCFEEGYYGTPDDIALYPERWANPRDPDKRLEWRKRIFRVNYLSASVLLGVLAIVMVWFSGT